MGIPKGRRDFCQRHPEEVVQGDDGAMTRIEALERSVDHLAVGQRARKVGRRGRIKGSDLDFDRSSTTTADDVETGVDGQPMQPGIEPVRVAQTRQVTPGADECLLDRVARELRIPKDEASGRVQPREGRVDESGEGVMIAPSRAFDELSLVHGRLCVVTTTAVMFDRVWRRRCAKGSSEPGGLGR
jgi:hypothetical protein